MIEVKNGKCIGRGRGGGELVHQSDVRFLWLAFVNP